MVVITNKKDKSLSYKVIQFNFDGDGSALIKIEDGSIHVFHKSDVLSLLEGDFGEDKQWETSLED